MRKIREKIVQMQKNIQSQFLLINVYSVQLKQNILLHLQQIPILPISDPSTKPDTDIPRVEQASKNLATTKIIYDVRDPNDG
jgi:hypothetical protein